MDRQDMEAAHSDGLHDGAPREGCPLCDDRRNRTGDSGPLGAAPGVAQLPTQRQLTDWLSGWLYMNTSTSRVRAKLAAPELVTALRDAGVLTTADDGQKGN